jgi:two-component system, chemotaxis family, sensor kinase CheA
MMNLRLATKVAVLGQVEIETVPGYGTVFKLQLPLTIAITEGILVRVGDLRYIVPSKAVAMAMRADQLFSIAEDGSTVAFHGRTIPMYRLGDLSSRREDPPDTSAVIVLHDGDTHAAVLVDEIVGKQQIVTQSMGEGVPVLGWISGSASLGDGHIGLIVEPVNLLARFRTPPVPHAA